ncbi:Imidazolonepropionase [Christiangramia echinicola]|uniref:Imidazolonepropionase n=1 Tax=Christiangramia echinicola TaxID=279359 RepID=A0A1H1M403_9FLAO|nr:Imidazolonepropionase [Christiangramia echinicola]
MVNTISPCPNSVNLLMPGAIVWNYKNRYLRKLFFILTLLLNVVLVCAQGSNSEKVFIKNIKLIDGTGGPIQNNTTVLIEDGVFKKVFNSPEFKIPKNVKIIDGKGKTMIPGLIGVHNHLHIPGNPFLGEIATKLYLASGVTTIQTCGAASPEKEIEIARKIETGEISGPEIIPSGPYITGIGGNMNMIIPQNEDQLRDLIKFWKDKGARWFKVYRNIEPEFLEIVIDEAHKNKLKVTGHLCSITFKEASEMGIDAIEHGLNSVSDFRGKKKAGKCSGSREYIDELDLASVEVEDLLDLLVENGTVLTSTLSIYEASVPSRKFIDERSLEIMSESFRNNFQNVSNSSNKEVSKTRKKRLKRIMEFEYRFYKKGGILSAGVDAGRHVLPGFGDQRNFILLKEAGFTTQEVIHIMTKNGAVKLGRTDIGTIETGKRADFMILDGDLEFDEKAIKRIYKVYKNGFSYNPGSLLKGLKGKYGNF